MQMNQCPTLMRQETGTKTSWEFFAERSTAYHTLFRRRSESTSVEPYKVDIALAQTLQCPRIIGFNLSSIDLSTNLNIIFSDFADIVYDL